MFAAYQDNVVDVDGWMRAGAAIGFSLNPHLGKDATPYTAADWRLFRPAPNSQKPVCDPESMRGPLERRYG